MIDCTSVCVQFTSITAHKPTTLSFVNILELVTFTPLEASNELIVPHPGSGRAIEGRPV